MKLRAKRHFPVLLLVLALALPSSAQQDSLHFLEPAPTFHKKRFRTLMITEGVGYSSAMVGLYALWYKNVPKSKFHFFNDNHEWLQMDKIGHSMSTYYLGHVGKEMLEWSGIEKRKALWYGGTQGLLFLTSIEIFDGFSSGWGASGGDILANMAGTGLLIGEELLWEEQRLQLKFSAHTTDFATYRPKALGSSLPERLLKDYNGQTYWLSANINSFLPNDSRFPKWLNVAVGYGADGMTGGSANPLQNEAGEDLPYFERQRQYYLSLDVDLSRIEVNSRFWRLVLHSINFVKVPMPTLALQDGKLRGYAFYF